MLTRWYIPTWSGDYRLEAAGADACRLLVTDPTPVEIERLGAFLVKARKKGWVDPVQGVALTGESVLTLKTSVVAAGKVLLARGERPKAGILTVVRSTAGVITAASDAETEAKVTAAPDAQAAVSTRRPTLCCPQCVTGPESRASRVLRTFCTARQWTDWEKHGWLVAFGQLSGHGYRVAHRHSRVAIAQGKPAWDLDDDHVVHAYDWSVPPAEEALAIKLALEHREAWVRNRSGYHDGPPPHYHNPFMAPEAQHADGLVDAALVAELGPAMAAGVLTAAW